MATKSFDRYRGTVQTTDSSATVLTGTNVTLPNSTSVLVMAKVIAIRTDVVGDKRGFFATVVVFRESGGGATTSGTQVNHFADGAAGAATWTVVITTATNDVNITVRGENAKTVQWHGEISFEPLYTP